MNHPLLQPNSKILFQGDSITDAGRNWGDGSTLGSGYANLIAIWLSAAYPERQMTFINRGISGNRIYDLEARWTDDCVALEPDIVSILIGINDTWRRYDSNVMSPIPEFETSYRSLLDRVKTETSARIIVLEPFVLEIPERAGWREDLDPRIEAIRRIARDYKVTYVPLDGIFAAASTRREPAFWAEDGVHPSQAGHALIAQEWIRAIGGSDQ